MEKNYITKYYYHYHWIWVTTYRRSNLINVLLIFACCYSLPNTNMLGWCFLLLSITIIFSSTHWLLILQLLFFYVNLRWLKQAPGPVHFSIQYLRLYSCSQQEYFFGVRFLAPKYISEPGGPSTFIILCLFPCEFFTSTDECSLSGHSSCLTQPIFVAFGLPEAPLTPH